MKRFGKALAMGAVLTAFVSSFAESPDWVLKTNCMTRVNRVEEVGQETGLVRIDTGLRSNLRIGAFCKVYRGQKHVGDVVVVMSERDRAVAMATSESEIKKGDAVYITPAN